MQKDPTGKVAPAGGFKTGGWYSGYQFWNGSFAPTAGQIHPSSNQAGAGGLVSNQVIAQTDPKNVAYIENLRKNPPAGAGQPVQTQPSGMPSAGTGLPSDGGTGNGVPLTMPESPTLNLPDLYKNLYSSSGVSDLEKQYSDMEKSFIESKGKTNDNPFLSEATRVGRVAKLESLFQERTANIKNDIATKKADIETQLNLQTKQFDINSQQAKTAFDQFNSLLGSGALDNASGESIAGITRATGISSDMIYSAINAQKAKNVKTEMIKSEDDNGNVTVSILDSNTGNVIKQTSLGAIGNKQTGTTTASDTKNIKATFSTDAKTSNFPDLIVKYANVMSLEEIYSAYLNSEMGKKYGKPTENAKEVSLLYKVAKGELTADQAKAELE